MEELSAGDQEFTRQSTQTTTLFESPVYVPSIQLVHGACPPLEILPVAQDTHAPPVTEVWPALQLPHVPPALEDLPALQSKHAPPLVEL